MSTVSASVLNNLKQSLQSRGADVDALFQQLDIQTEHLVDARATIEEALLRDIWWQASQITNEPHLGYTLAAKVARKAWG